MGEKPENFEVEKKIAQLLGITNTTREIWNVWKKEAAGLKTKIRHRTGRPG